MWGGLRLLFDFAPWFTLANLLAILLVGIVRRIRS